MGNLANFEIDLRNLGETDSVFHYRLDDDFFHAVEAGGISQGELDAVLSISKTGHVFEMDFNAEGFVCVTCDRCLELMRLPLVAKERLCACLGSEYAENDDVIVVPEEVGTLNVAELFAELVNLAVPIRHVHEDGQCDEDMLERLRQYSNEDNDATAADPRWKELEKLKTIIKD